MPEAKIVDQYKICDLNGWSSEEETFSIPENTEGVRFEAFSEVEKTDANRGRLLMIVVLTVGPRHSEEMELKNLDQKWLLVTPFGNLGFRKKQSSSCTLRKSGRDLVFTYITDWPEQTPQAPRQIH